jgi:hypothetical protein
MRYNPSTDCASTIEDLAAENRAAIQRRRDEMHQSPTPMMLQAEDAFYVGACKTWIVCLQCCAENDRTARARLENYLARDMHRAMHHRPHQSEF